MRSGTDQLFEVTAEWIHRHCTARGGWTKQALAVLDVEWPPRPGWIRRSVGRLLTDRQRQFFESCGQRASLKQASLLPPD
jgi:hypothetical protein